MDAVGDNGARAGAAPRPHGDPRLLGVVDEIPDDQIIVDIAHGADDTDLILHALPVFLGFLGIPFPEAFIAELSEVFLVGIPLRHRIGGQMILVEGKLHIAHIGNFRRIVKGLVAAREQSPQLLLAFQIEFLGLEAHPVLIVNGLSRLDAQEHILHIGILSAQVVGIVGDHKGKPLLPGQAL